MIAALADTDAIRRTITERQDLTVAELRRISLRLLDCVKEIAKQIPTKEGKK